ncbi:MAG: hypothetical protein AAB456_03390 [Patescibacteria group bacterium]
MANLNHADYFPSLKKDAVEDAVETFSSGTTKTITNNNVKSTSRVVFMYVNRPPEGRWSVAVSANSIVITSSDAENGVTFKYLVL